LTSPIFINVGAWQQADIPVAFFFLSGIAFLFLQDRFPEKYGVSLLSGIMAGLAGWTKNEGLLFLGSFFMARAVTTFFSRNRKMHVRQLVYFIFGSMPVLTVILYFKIYLAPSSEIISGGFVNEIAEKLIEPVRYAQILKTFLLNILFAYPQILLLLLYLFYLGVNNDNKRNMSFAISLLVLVLMLFGYYSVYLITPYDLDWHLTFSVQRLFLQLWPSFLFVFFMIVRTPEEALAEGQIKLDAERGVRMGSYDI
jgi:hypothetical protein